MLNGKRIATFLIFVLGLSLAACGGQSGPAERVDAFFTAAADGNLQTATGMFVEEKQTAGIRKVLRHRFYEQLPDSLTGTGRSPVIIDSTHQQGEIAEVFVTGVNDAVGDGVIETVKIDGRWLISNVK